MTIFKKSYLRVFWESVAIIAIFALVGSAAGWGFSEFQKEELIKMGDYSQYLDGNPVKVFATEWCPGCSKVKDYLSAQDIPFDLVDIERSELTMREFRELNVNHIPLILFADRLVIGFDEKA